MFALLASSVQPVKPQNLETFGHIQGYLSFSSYRNFFHNEIFAYGNGFQFIMICLTVIFKSRKNALIASEGKKEALPGFPKRSNVTNIIFSYL